MPWPRPAGLLFALVVLVSGCSAESHPGPATDPAVTAAVLFLDRYVRPDGRVVRSDQGGDIVSEGQAYGMLLAEVAGRERLAHTIWGWTRSHLRRPDGLLSFHANGSGVVLDSNSASDADILCAYALVRYRGPDQQSLRAAGRDLARAVITSESTTVAGAPVIVAGTWATTAPEVVNPSYWMPGVFRALATDTGDQRWERAAEEAVRLLVQLTDGGQRLPPDWARLSAGGVEATAAPDGSNPVQYGLDAARLPVWLSTACTEPARDLAGRWWTRRLAQTVDLAALARSLSGQPTNQVQHPLPLVAAAAASASVADSSRSAALLAQAKDLASRTPTYYGDAWVGLGSALMRGDLDPCAKDSGH